MNAGLTVDPVIVVLSVVVTIIFYAYSKNKIAIDKKVMQNDALTKAEKMITDSAKVIVYQTEKEDGSSKDKLLTTFNYSAATLDLACLPRPPTVYTRGGIEEPVTMMKQMKNFVDSMQTLIKEDDAAKQSESKTIVGRLKEAKK